MNYKDRMHVDLHVIDSVDKEDFDNGKIDSTMLKERLADTAINIVAHEARNVDSLTAALETIVEYRTMYMCGVRLGT